MTDMAEADKNDSAVLIQSVAATSEALSYSLLKFATKWDSGQHFINNIAVTASGIASLLRDVVENIQRCPEATGPHDNAINTLCNLIRADLEIVVKALEMADLKAGPGRFVAKRQSRITAIRRGENPDSVRDTEWNDGMMDQNSRTQRLDGGALLRGELYDPWAPDNLEVAKYNLWYFYEGLRYLTLRKLEREGRLQADEVEELKRLFEHLPNVLTELESRKTIILRAAERLKESQALDVQGINDGSVNNSRWKLEINERSVARQNVDDDVRSIASFNSTASYQFLGINELYEGWVIRKFEGETNWPRRWWSLGWFTVYEYCNNSGYEIESQVLNNDQIKEQNEVDPKQTTLIEKTIATLPPGVQQEIKIILEDRTRVSSNARFTRKWKIVDIKVKVPKPETPVPVWRMLWDREPAFSEALFILKGETADPNEETKPLRFEDPFRKPQYRRGYGVPADRREYPQEVFVERGPQRRDLRANRRVRGIGDRVSEPPKALDPEETETKIQDILAEIGGLA